MAGSGSGSGSRRKTSVRATRGAVARSAATTRARSSAPTRSRASAKTSSRASANTRAGARSAVQIKWVRLGMLVLVLIAASLYVTPLRDFFTQQTKYAQQQAILSAARRENRALTAQVAELKTTQFVLETAREDFQLVPPGMQEFVVKGLPRAKTTADTADAADATPRRVTMSLGERLSDLWHTILQ